MGKAQELAQLTSMVLTGPTIILAMAVVWVWAPPAAKALRQRRRLSSADWFMVGVTAGFIGSVLDNAYWTVPWSLNYTGSTLAEGGFAVGIFFNVISRQALGTVAAYCHLRAAREAESLQQMVLNRIVGWSWVCGILYGVALVFMRG